MIPYNKVHTTGNSQPGGDRGGFFIVSHMDILLFVRKAATPPTIRGINMQTPKICFLFLIEISLPYPSCWGIGSSISVSIL
jgi:hypothetical protein